LFLHSYFSPYRLFLLGILVAHLHAILALIIPYTAAAFIETSTVPAVFFLLIMATSDRMTAVSVVIYTSRISSSYYLPATPIVALVTS
jgi:hypothetical protein